MALLREFYFKSIMKKEEVRLDAIDQLLQRGVEEIIDKKNLEQKVKSGKNFVLNLGLIQQVQIFTLEDLYPC